MKDTQIMKISSISSLVLLIIMQGGYFSCIQQTVNSKTEGIKEIASVTMFGGLLQPIIILEILNILFVFSINAKHKKSIAITSLSFNAIANILFLITLNIIKNNNVVSNIAFVLPVALFEGCTIVNCVMALLTVTVPSQNTAKGN